MTYEGIDRRRFIQLLEWGAADDELRRFFADCRVQLIQRGAKVQNPPRGKSARVRMLAQGLPPATDRLVQRWFNQHLTMLDPKPASELVAELRLYEEVGESPPEDEAKRLARSCLVHLFSSDPPADLVSFLRPAQAGNAAEPSEAQAEPVNGQSSDAFPVALGQALVALAEGRDPDEYLSSLSSTTASFVAGLQAVRSGREDEAKIALEALDHEPEVRALLLEYAARSASARTGNAVRGLQMLRFASPDEAFSFDFDRDEVLAVCTRDYPETTVFLHPFAIRAADGSWIDLSNDIDCQKLFYTSGDLIAFPGRDSPRQPKRGEIGIWRVAENKGANTGHRTNFHIASEMTPVYEVRDVPFPSTDYDSVREYIKHQFEQGEVLLATKPLFVLRDQLVVGCPPGKDLSRDEGFESGLPCWQTLSACRFEGRVLVPGPLPPPETYECEALGTSLRKLFAKGEWRTDKPTKALARKLQELIASGEPGLRSARVARLRAELSFIDQHEGAMDALLDEIMRDPSISARVDEQVNARVEALIEQQEQLRNSVQQLEQKKRDLQEQQRKAERDQKAVAPAIAKAIRGAFDKARGDALGTLGQVAVFKALIDELIERPAAPGGGAGPAHPDPTYAGFRTSASIVRLPRGEPLPVIETLRALGVTPKSARAIELVGHMAHQCGLILIIDGLAGRLAAEVWLSGNETSGKVFECGIGEVEDHQIRSIVADAPETLAILDANLSPLDLYARPLIDAVQRRLAGIDVGTFATRILMSVSDDTASLPVPATVESLSLRVSLDRIPMFAQDNEVARQLEEIDSTDTSAGWFARIWKPARPRVLSHLRSVPIEDVAFIFAALEAAEIKGTD
ncbi:Uncharacterised protein [Burkholderia pseudomallei]|uniref:hypothetical protein n=1 Tax=Burkholderia pseudomallei TaxID=28450 RepID=UPI000F1F67AA|nr:hypothetical protein [Burkholderia pseudomallei]VBI35263.1 Uncharacterised protein [Burkholderia pseudomallei]